MKTMIKRISCFALAALMILSMSACRNKEEPEIEEIPVVEYEYNITTRIVDEWRVDNEDGSRTYYISLHAETDKMYCEPSADNVKYTTNDGSKPLMEAIEGSDIKIIHYNDGHKKSTSSSIIISTPDMIDKNKIRIIYSGPSSYDPDATDRESYEAKHGIGSWGSLNSTISSSTFSSSLIISVADNVDHGLMSKVIDSKGETYTVAAYVDNRAHNSMVVESDVAYLYLPTICINRWDAAPSVDGLSQVFSPKNINDKEAEIVKLDENISTYLEYVDGAFKIGYKTVDGSDIQPYLENIPDWIEFTYMSGSLFLKFE